MSIPFSGIRAAAALLALAAVAGSAGAAEDIPIDRLELQMGPLDGKVLLRKDPNDSSSFPVTVTDPARRMERMPGRIEVKGAFTRVMPKKSILIKLDSHKWRGSSRIALNAMATDGSQMREYLAWKMMHALGMAVPEVGYTRVSLNGRDLGAYLRIEWIDGTVFERHGLGKEGDYFQPLDATYCGDLSPASIEDSEWCWRKIMSRDGFAPIEALVRNVDQATPVSVNELVTTALEPESLVNWLAVNALVSDSDVYNKNYFLFRSKRIGGRWVVVPFDYDITFGRTYDPYREAPFTILNSNFSYFYPLALGAPNALRTKALMNPELGARVRARIAELIEGRPDRLRPWRGWFEPSRMDARMDQLYERLLPLIGNDAILAGDRVRFQEEVDAVRHYVRARVQYVKRVIVGRAIEQIDHATAKLPQHRGVAHFTNGIGYLLGYLRTVHAPPGAQATLEIHKGAPELLPPGVPREACVRRAWRLTTKGLTHRVAADFTVEYLEETSRRHELGEGIGNERRLTLFRRDAGRDTEWRALPTEANAVANTVTVRAMALPSGRAAWFAACETAPTLEARSAE